MGDSRVARSELWWRKYPAIFRREVETARKRKFRLSVTMGAGDGDAPERLVARGRVRVKAARPGEPERWHGFDVEVVYPDGFPFDKPDVIPSDPTIRRRRHQMVAGDLCYTQEELAPWDLGDGLERALDGARQWFEGEVTGRFEHEVPASELLFYLERETSRIRALLIPEHAVWNDPAAARWGEITVEWDGQAQGLAVLGVHRMRDAELPPGASIHVREENGRLWRALRGPAKLKGVPGVWFRLDREPRPFRNMAEMLEALEEVGVPRTTFREVVEGRLGSELRRGGWLPVGLDFPRDMRGERDQGAEREWLWVSIEWPTMPEHLRKARRLRTGVFWDRYAVLKGIASYPVRPEDLRRRIGGIYPHAPLERAHVVIVGAGAIGSTAARALVAAGVWRVTIVEHDTVKPGNVVRHEARFPDVGKLKADAMEQILVETNPFVRTEKVHGTRFDRQKFEAVMASPRFPPALVLSFTASRAVAGQVEDVARRIDPTVPVLHAALQAEAQVLRAFVYRAGRTACSYCNQFHANDAEAGIPNGYLRVPDEIADQPFFEASCASPAFPGSGNANALAAHVAVEMALDVLGDRLPDSESHWIFAGNRVRDRVPGFPVDPLSIARNGFEPHPRCPVCADSILTEDLSAEEREAYDCELARIMGEV